MSGVIDWLEYIDKVDDSYKKDIERLVADEVDKVTLIHQHPVVDRLLPAIRHRWDDQYQRYKSNSRGESPKRRITEQLSPSSAKLRRIDILDEFNMGSSKLEDVKDVDKLGIMISYLKHQEITLKKFLCKTLNNQWIVNGEYLKQVKQTIQQKLDTEKKQIQQLNSYRRELQQHELNTFRSLEAQWREMLNKGIERGL